MPGFSGLAFAAPWVLAALVVLPLIWWLLKVTPPAPKRVFFPAIRLLFGLRREEETPAKTPPWLIALRLLAAGLLIVSLAHPLINPDAKVAGGGPMVLAIDDGWAAARRWERRQAALGALLDRAGREERPVIVLTTAPAGSGATVAPSRLMRAEEARNLVQGLRPKPWPVDRDAARRAVERLEITGTAEVFWLADGLDDDNLAGFARALRRLGPVEVLTDPDLDRTRAVLPPETGPGSLRVAVVRAVDAGAETLWLRASGEDGQVLARESVDFAAGERRVEVGIDAPAEMRNRITRLNIEGERSAAAVVLLDERWRRRPVGLVSGGPIEENQPLLSEIYYLERALTPFSEVRKGEIRDLLKRPLAVLVLADVAKVIGEERTALANWIEAGGVLIRFAGPHLAENADELVPVTLRGGGRILGGALSWSRPAMLAPFDSDTPFAGLDVPPDVRVRRQVLAEPSLDLAAKTWARLADGTPLVTAERRGAGWLVLVHTTANTTWSNLAISGLFVEMLERIVELSQGIAGKVEEGKMAPLRTLDGFGRLGEPPATSRALATADFAEAKAGPLHPPGFYGVGGARRALNLTAGLTEPRAVETWPKGIERRILGEVGEIDLKPWLLTLALLVVLADLMIGLSLRGLLRLGATGAAFALVLGATPAPAQQTEPDAFALLATLQTRLAYVESGDPTVDEISRAGLEGLGVMLRARTSIEPASPLAIDVERNELIFFPLIYWPVTSAQPRLSPEALARVDHYLKTGGIILFDTRDQNARFARQVGGAGPNAQRLRTLLEGINIAPLQPVPPDHVLTRSFYLMQDFPGRWTGGVVWVERHEGGVNDGVSSLIIGSHDWAAAWAMDSRQRPLFAVVPGGERQREQAYRFGINLVMYAMTGNYKADQVHLPAILERLGQ
ncbi:MAG: DUF4159 domain-containing protein [Alphaproteobacteria bacterium]